MVAPTCVGRELQAFYVRAAPASCRGGFFDVIFLRRRRRIVFAPLSSRPARNQFFCVVSSYRGGGSNLSRPARNLFFCVVSSNRGGGSNLSRPARNLHFCVMSSYRAGGSKSSRPARNLFGLWAFAGVPAGLFFLLPCAVVRLRDRHFHTSGKAFVWQHEGLRDVA
jgi:hypothetical protein